MWLIKEAECIHLKNYLNDSAVQKTQNNVFVLPCSYVNIILVFVLRLERGKVDKKEDISYNDSRKF